MPPRAVPWRLCASPRSSVTAFCSTRSCAGWRYHRGHRLVAALLIAAAIAAGAVRGLFTLLEATAISDRWGPAGYASLNGVLSAPLTAAIALAPTADAALAGALGNCPALFLALAGTSLISGALMTGTGTRTKPHDHARGGKPGGKAQRATDCPNGDRSPRPAWWARMVG